MKNFNHLICRLNLILTILFVLTSVLSMYFSNALSNKGEVLTQTENQVEIIKKENAYLKAKIYTMTSLNNINVIAQEKGLAKGSIDFYDSPAFANAR